MDTEKSISSETCDIPAIAVVPPTPPLVQTMETVRLPISIRLIAYATLLIALFWFSRIVHDVIEIVVGQFPGSLFTSMIHITSLLAYACSGVGLLIRAPWARKYTIGIAIFSLCISALGAFTLTGISFPQLRWIQWLIVVIPLVIYIPALVILTRPHIRALFSPKPQHNLS